MGYNDPDTLYLVDFGISKVINPENIEEKKRKKIILNRNNKMKKLITIRSRKN